MIGCGLSVAVAAVLAYLLIRRSMAVVLLSGAATIGFAVPWSMDAASTDDTGMWGVGLFFLLVGGGAGLALLLVITHVLTLDEINKGFALMRPPPSCGAAS